jgi:hypothetical protein
MVAAANLTGKTKMDGSDTLHLGTETAPWQIKDFSVTLRQKAARDQGVTVAEFPHAHFTRLAASFRLWFRNSLTERCMPCETVAFKLFRKV